MTSNVPDNLISRVLFQCKGPKNVWPAFKITHTQSNSSIYGAVDMVVKRVNFGFKVIQFHTLAKTTLCCLGQVIRSLLNHFIYRMRFCVFGC